MAVPPRIGVTTVLGCISQYPFLTGVTLKIDGGEPLT
jgi:hypothetical protein